MLGCVAAGAARATDDLGAPPSPAERCLSPAPADRAKPVYPADMLDLKRAALVRAKFTFTGPDSAPDVDFFGESDWNFHKAVSDYARQLRVPCMGSADAKVAITQEFDFVPNDGRKVALTVPTDAATPDRRTQAACGVRLTGVGIPSIDYPERQLRERQEGNVVARLRFTDPEKPPELTVLDNGGSNLFVRAIEPAVDALRMTCVGKDPIVTQVVYRFILDGGAKENIVLRDQTLVQFLGSVQPIAPGSVYFDTGRMKCPFDVRLTFRQPWNRNRIDELEEDVESRHAFLDWLSTLQFDLSPRIANRLLGQPMNIHVPCAVLNL